MPFRARFLFNQRTFFLSHLLFCYPVFVIFALPGTCPLFTREASFCCPSRISAGFTMRITSDLLLSGIGHASLAFALGRCRLLTARE